jgi:DnaJ family protein C protein 19
MPPILIGLVVLFGGLWLLRKYAKLTPQESRVFTARLTAVGIMAFAVFLFLHGNFAFGSGLLVFGMGLYGTSKLPDFKSMFRARQASGRPSSLAGNPSRESAFGILGLKTGASEDEIRKAHRQLMKDHHPDAGGSEEMAAKINAAKDVLLG